MRSAHELRAEPELRAKPERKRGRGLGKELGVPPQNFFEKSNLKTIRFGAYLKQIFETNNMVRGMCSIVHIHRPINSDYRM